jgi:hypothetical protein
MGRLRPLPTPEPPAEDADMSLSAAADSGFSSRALLALVVALVPAAASAQARTMRWTALHVEARLDARGDLHVTERQVIVFDGAWNGGERIFRVSPGQRLRFERLSRETAGGRLVPLVRGDLRRVDHYDFTERDVLRWRSRGADAPPFAAATLAYVLEYTLSGVLARERDEGYLLDHDFAFPDRAWPIQAARASLDLDPAWQAEGAGPLHLEAGPLAPGVGLVARVRLRWVGAGAGPALPGEGLPRPQRAALAAALAAILAAAGGVLLRHARGRGQLAPPPDPAQVDDAFLREHVLSRPPEVVGAAYDDAIGAPEVAAVLARLAGEGKLGARVERHRRLLGPRRDVLHLALRVERGRLEGHERSLVDALFVDGETIDSDRLKAHYRKSGFDPADRIRSALQRAVRALAPAGRVAVLVPSLSAAALLVLGVLLAIPGAAGPPLVLSIHGVVWPLVGVVLLSARLRRAATGFVRRALALAAVLGAWGSAVLWLAAGGFRTDGWWIAAHACFWAAGVVVAATLGRTPLGPEEMALRKRLAAARVHLARELGRERPRLDDAWLPYLLAFGLGPDVDRWFGAHGAAGRSASAGMAETHGGATGGAARWTGGGGAFSGGGATGTWAAFGAMAASIATPGSGSGSGSGGGGGSSSGGGGGGGW